MEMQQQTVSDALRANVATLMEWRNIHAAQLGRRMAAIGFDGWKHRKTSVRFLKPTRDARKAISPDELMGLALVLDTTVEMLLTGSIEEASRHIRATGYSVGAWPLTGGEIRRTITDDEVTRNPTGLTAHGIRWNHDDTPKTQGVDIAAQDRAGRDQLRKLIERRGGTVPDDYYTMSLIELIELLPEETD